MACAAGLATLETLEEEGLLARARELGRAGLARLQAMKVRHPAIRDVRGFGCYFGVEIDGPDAPTANALADRLLYLCLARGLSFKLGGGNAVTLCPPLTIPDDQFEAAFAILDEALSDLSP